MMLYVLIAQGIVIAGLVWTMAVVIRERDDWCDIAHQALTREDGLKKQLGLGRHRDGPTFHAEDLPENFLG